MGAMEFQAQFLKPNAATPAAELEFNRTRDLGNR